MSSRGGQPRRSPGVTGVSPRGVWRGWRAQFALLAAIWGSSFLFIKVLDDERWPALWVALGRISLGALTLVILVRRRRESLRFDPRLWVHLAVAGTFFIAAPFTLIAYGETKISSILAGLWNGTTPLWVLFVVMVAFSEERPDRRRVLGLAIGFAGVVIVLGPWRALGQAQLIGQLACAGASACYGVGFPYTRRYLASRPESCVALAAGQLICATLILALFAPFARAPTARLGLDGLGSLLALGVLGSGVAYVLNYAVVRAAGATTASTVTYLIPIVSTVLGVVVLAEPLRWNQPVGAMVLFAGIAISQGRLWRLATGRRAAGRR
jgi:drug/metabolite transporter (DMT)-like permease